MSSTSSVPSELPPSHSSRHSSPSPHISQARLLELGDEEVSKRLQEAASLKVPPGRNLAATLQRRSLQGHSAVFVEVARNSPSDPPERLAERCRQIVGWGECHARNHTVNTCRLSTFTTVLFFLAPCIAECACPSLLHPACARA